MLTALHCPAGLHGHLKSFSPAGPMMTHWQASLPVYAAWPHSPGAWLPAPAAVAQVASVASGGAHQHPSLDSKLPPAANQADKKKAMRAVTTTLLSRCAICIEHL
jgi:hypothetical protein